MMDCHSGIILTDGRSNNEEKTWNEAMKTRDAGIHLIAVGIGTSKFYNCLSASINI